MSYVCELCNEIILPIISYEKDCVVYSIESYAIRGGCGNKLIYKHICPNCQNKLNLKKEWAYENCSPW